MRVGRPFGAVWLLPLCATVAACGVVATPATLPIEKAAREHRYLADQQAAASDGRAREVDGPTAEPVEPSPISGLPTH